MSHFVYGASTFIGIGECSGCAGVISANNFIVNNDALFVIGHPEAGGPAGVVYGGIGIAEDTVCIVVGHVANPDIEVSGGVPGVGAAGGSEFHVIAELIVEGSPLGYGGSFSDDSVGGIPLGIGSCKFKLDAGASYEGFKNVACTCGVGIESVKIAV